MSVLKDSASMWEEIDVNGDVTRTKKASMFGIVEVSHYDGSTMFTNNTIEGNDLLINGAIYFLEKGNNVRSDFVSPSIDEDLAISLAQDISRTSETLAKEVIIGIVVGIGGCGDTRTTIKSVLKHHKNVPTMVPFRVSVDRLPVDERSKYVLEKFTDNKWYYWGKKFDIQQFIRAMYSNGVEVPSNIHNVIDPGPIECYTDYKVTVGAKDIREYFLLLDGNTMNSRINTVGLIAGYPDVVNGETIYRNVRCLTTANMENKDLKDDLSTVSFIYRHHLE